MDIEHDIDRERIEDAGYPFDILEIVTILAQENFQDEIEEYGKGKNWLQCSHIELKTEAIRKIEGDYVTESEVADAINYLLFALETSNKEYYDSLDNENVSEETVSTDEFDFDVGDVVIEQEDYGINAIASSDLGAGDNIMERKILKIVDRFISPNTGKVVYQVEKYHPTENYTHKDMTTTISEHTHKIAPDDEVPDGIFESGKELE